MGQKCFAFTSCMNQPAGATDKPIDRPTNPPFTDSHVTLELEPIIPAPMSEDEAPMPEGRDSTPCPFAGEYRSQYGFCGLSFIYCNALSSWSLENCGLYAADVNGEPVLCDVEVLKCPEGEEVYRDPWNECEYFPCPDTEEEETVMASAFHILAPTPTFSELPQPTLPTIHKTSPFTFSSVSKPSAGIINPVKKPSGDSTSVVIGTDEDVEDDKDESSESIEDDKPKSIGNEMEFGSFSARDWLANSACDVSHNEVVNCGTFFNTDIQ